MCFIWLVCVTVVECGVYGLKKSWNIYCYEHYRKKVTSYELGYIFLLSILMYLEFMNIFYL